MTTKSPAVNVPDAGAPEAVAPAYLDAAVAPVSPVGANAGGEGWTCLASAAMPWFPAAAVPGLAWMSPVVASIGVTATAAQDPGDPAEVQIQNAPVRSTVKSPTANVPETGCPALVAPTYRLTAVAPVSPDGA